ncbi:hypothetical protein U1Q18_011224 [Sarracenia purpurea var. burkii]
MNQRSKAAASGWGSEPSTANSPAQLRVQRAREKPSRTIAPLDLARDDSLCDFRQCATLSDLRWRERGKRKFFHATLSVEIGTNKVDPRSKMMKWMKAIGYQ